MSRTSMMPPAAGDPLDIIALAQHVPGEAAGGVEGAMA